LVAIERVRRCLNCSKKAGKSIKPRLFCYLKRHKIYKMGVSGKTHGH